MSQFLPHQVITDLNDAQENFDAIDGHVLQVANNLSDVTAATARTNLGLGSIATKGFAAGSSGIIFSTSNIGVAVTITHGLGTTPSFVGITPNHGLAGGTVIEFSTASIGAATFQVNASCNNNLNTTLAFLWCAIA